MLKLQMTSGHVRAEHLQPQYGFPKLRSNVVANNWNTLQKCSIYIRRIISLNTRYTQNWLFNAECHTPSNDSFKRVLSIQSKLTNNRNITRFSLTALCFLNGGQHIGNVGVTRDDKAGDMLKPIRIYWDTSLLTLYRLQTTHRDGTKHLLEQTSSYPPKTIWVQNGRFKTQSVKSSTLKTPRPRPKYHVNV